MAEVDENGGDQFYPNGSVIFHETSFDVIDTARIKNKSPLWIFRGDSNSGKTFLSSQFTNLKVLETDNLPDGNMPKVLSEYDVIVVGNRFPIDPIEASDREIINVSFSIQL